MQQNWCSQINEQMTRFFLLNQKYRAQPVQFRNKRLFYVWLFLVNQ